MATAGLRIAALVLMTALAVACQPRGEQSLSNDAENAPTAADVPGGAIKVTDKLYMVPVSTDETGCQQYSAHAIGGLAPTVIYYRRADGTFTEDRAEADCA